MKTVERGTKCQQILARKQKGRRSAWRSERVPFKTRLKNRTAKKSLRGKTKGRRHSKIS